MEASVRSNKDLLTEFYSTHDPAKVEKADAILAGWPLAELLEALRGKYGECPDLVAPPPAQKEQDAGIISSEDSDLIVVSAKIKKKKKHKKGKKDKKNGVNALTAVANNKTAIGDGAPADKQKVPQNWGRGKNNWWTEAMKEVNNVKRKLTRKAMGFIDEAVRLSREEKLRQAAERREARELGLKNQVSLVEIEDDVVPDPIREAATDDAFFESAAHGQLDENYEFRPAESGGEEDDDGNQTAKKRTRVEIQERKKSHKELMDEALGEHFKAVEDAEGEGAEAPVPGEGTFKEYEAFNAKKAHDVAHGLGKEGDVPDSGSSDDSSEEDNPMNRIKRPTDYWGKPPEELLARTDLEESVDGSRAFIAHFVRYVMGTWNLYFEDEVKIEGNGLTEGACASFNSRMVLEKTKEALTPLLERLQRNTVEKDHLLQIDNIASLAAARDYKSSMQQYVLTTMGRKTWHMTHMQTMMQQNHGGSVAKILKQSDFVSFDYDPTINAYTLALKRVIQFLQWLRPPTEISMGSYM